MAKQDPKGKKPKLSTEGMDKPAKTETAQPVAVQLVPLASIKPNPTNPRVLRDEKFIKLKNSLQDFPDMLNYRAIVTVTDTDGKLMVLGGNMRLRALQDLGVKEAPVMIADHWTEEQRREFIVKDNVGFGEWDWDQLANEWDGGKLAEWGLDLPTDYSDANKEIDVDGMADEMTIKLKYTEGEYTKVRDALALVAATPEQAVYQLLKL